MNEINPNSSPEKKISLMIIGAQKAGTTSLKNYLGQHPDLETHPHKEFSHFFDANEYSKGSDVAFQKYFDETSSKPLFIAKNAGLFVSEPGILRLKEHNKDCKLVFMLRNPIERTYSSFLMEKNYGAIKGSFESLEPIIRKNDITDWRFEFFVGMSLYCNHLSMLQKHFNKDQMKIIRYADFKNNPAAICTDLFKWLKVDETFVPDTSVKHNVTHVNRSSNYGRFVVQLLRNHSPLKKIARIMMPGKMDYKVGEMLRNINKTNRLHSKMPESMYHLLREYYEPFNNELSEMTGIDFSDWNQKAHKK